MMLELKKGIIYGPVNSRRLGPSLGVNLLPSACKVCTFDCLYCQYGLNAEVPSPARAEALFPTVGEVEATLEESLRTLTVPPAYITFSGNGEPTLHPRFPQMVESVIRLRDALARGASTAILSNSTTTGSPAVRAALRRLDVRIMKLDAGSEETLGRFSRPREGLTLEKIVRGLAELQDVTLQALFAAGPLGNLGVDDVSAWVERVREISPRFVQLYTLSRQSPCTDIIPAPLEALLAIKRRLNAFGIAAEVY